MTQIRRSGSSSTAKPNTHKKPQVTLYGQRWFRREPRYIIVFMDAEKLKQIEIIYEQLLGLFHGMGTPSETHKVSGGPITQYEKIVADLEAITGEGLQHFMPETTRNSTGIWYLSKDLKTQSSSLISWVRASFLPKKETPHYIQPNNPATSISQTVNQDVNVTVSVVVELMNFLNEKEKEFEEGSKERGFIDKLKAGLKGVKDTTSILALIPQIAVQCGITLAELHKIFS